MVLATYAALYWLRGLARPGRDDSSHACFAIINNSIFHLERAGQLTDDGGLSKMNEFAHADLLDKLVKCASRPYDPSRPEHYDAHPTAVAWDTLHGLCSASRYIGDILRKTGAFRPLAAALFTHVERAETALPDCRPLMRLSVVNGFLLVHGMLVNTPETLDERAEIWSGPANPFALIATWCGTLFNGDIRCTCIKQTLTWFLDSARKAMIGADEGDGLPSSQTSAIALAIPQAIRAVVTADATAAGEVERRQMLPAWLELAPVAGITDNPTSFYCCGCGAADAHFRCERCRSAVCASLLPLASLISQAAASANARRGPVRPLAVLAARLTRAAHRPFCTRSGLKAPPPITRALSCLECDSTRQAALAGA